MTRLNIRQMTIAYAGATVCAVSTGAVGAVLWNEAGGRVDVGVAILGTWFVVVGVPSLVASVEALRRTLGIRSPPSVVSNLPGRVRGRPVRINLPSGPITEFMTTLPGGDRSRPIRLPDSWTVTIDGVQFTVTESELSSFVTRVWRRQRSGRSGLSRSYWTREHRPRMSRQEYEATVTLLLGVSGLIVDRGSRRSGRMILPPGLAIAAVSGEMNWTG